MHRWGSKCENAAMSLQYRHMKASDQQKERTGRGELIKPKKKKKSTKDMHFGK